MILVTGSLWLKKGYRSIGVVIRELAMKAKNETIMTLYTPGSTAEPAIDLLKILLKKAVNVQVVVNKWNAQPEHLRKSLLSMKQKNPLRLRIYNFRGHRGCILHAKAFVVDGKKAVVGSSNLSWSGIYSNYEIAVLLEGRDAEKVTQLLYTIIRSPLCKEIGVHRRVSQPSKFQTQQRDPDTKYDV